MHEYTYPKSRSRCRGTEHSLLIKWWHKVIEVKSEYTFFLVSSLIHIFLPLRSGSLSKILMATLSPVRMLRASFTTELFPLPKISPSSYFSMQRVRLGLGLVLGSGLGSGSGLGLGWGLMLVLPCSMAIIFFTLFISLWLCSFFLAERLM